MTLRSEIHSAFDEVAPSTFGLPERVVQTVLTEIPIRHRKEGLMFRLRAPMSLVAVFLLIALAAAVLVGGRLIQDWNASHNAAPAGSSNESVLAQLESRPMHLPVVSSISGCPNGPANADNSFASGPVYGVGGPATSSGWGFYFHNLAFANVKVAGPVLVRARDLFTNKPVVFVGTYAAGPVVGTDTVDGNVVQQHSELVIETNATSPDLGHWWASSPRHSFDWPFTAGVPTNWSGSSGWQIDGPGFSEVFLAC